MKPVVLVLAGSLVVNAALLTFLAQGIAQRKSLPAAAPAATALSTTAANTSARNDAERPLAPDTWETLKTDDLRGFIDRLQAEGFPPAIVRAIVTGQVYERYRDRYRALNSSQRPFWKQYSIDPKTRAAMQEISREQRALIRELLGPAPAETDPYRAAMNERRFGPLPPEKIDQLQAIQEEYDEKRSSIYGYSRGQPLPDEAQKLRTLEQEMRADFARVLTPEEFETYQLRGSNTANQIRYELTAFDATEEEFKTIFRLRQPFDDQFSFNFGMPSQDQMRARAEAEKQMKEQIKAALGPERGAAYERATDYSYRQTSALVGRLQLPPATTDQVYALQKEFESRVRSLGPNSGLSPAERNQQLATLNQEATTRLSSTLTPRGFEAYRANGGQWLRMLQPRPTPNATREAVRAVP